MIFKKSMIFNIQLKVVSFEDHNSRKVENLEKAHHSSENDFDDDISPFQCNVDGRPWGSPSSK
ncbi:MAG: hypothetical protein VW397_03610 [Candidatus Margulisiibacteriota bacterium]